MTNTPERSVEMITGEQVFSWTALNYHPHKRGWKWIAMFCVVFFGSAIWALTKGDWIMAFALFLAVAVYFLVHRNGDQEHEVMVFEKGILIDQKYFPMEKFEGYWFVYDQTVSVLNLQISGKGDRQIALQMGDKDPDFFRTEFQSTKLEELLEKKESLIDLWIRALKL
jgi:hypothetical protein